MYKSTLILYNITKNRNFGGLIRTANALGVTEIILIGKRSVKRYGHCGTFDSSKLRHFYTMSDASSYLKGKDFQIFGVEIGSNAKGIENHPFHGNTAFFPGNEGTGLNELQKSYCDDMVYIKQFGTGASLNVNVATGIVLHHFSVWANFRSNRIEAQRFIPSKIEPICCQKLWQERSTLGLTRIVNYELMNSKIR